MKYLRKSKGKRGHIFLEEILLIAFSIAIFITLITIVGGLVSNTTQNILSLQDYVKNSVQNFINSVSNVINNAFNIGGNQQGQSK